MIESLDELPPLAVILAAHICLIELEKYVPNTSDDVVIKLCVGFLSVFDQIPNKLSKAEFLQAYQAWQQDHSFDNHKLSVPLHDLLKNPAEAIYDLCGTFFHREIMEEGLF